MAINPELVKQELLGALSRSDKVAEALRNTYAWFEVNSGWAQPDAENLAEWVADGVCRCPDDCIVAPDAWCTHGLASWWLIIDALDEP